MSAQPEPYVLPSRGGATRTSRTSVILPMPPRGAAADVDPQAGAEHRLRPARGIVIGLVAGLLLWIAIGMTVHALMRL